MVLIAAGIYLVAGMLLATVGPGRKGIADAVRKIRGSPIAPSIVGESPPQWKLIFFRVLLIGGFILFWPFLIWGVLQEDKPEVPADPDEWFPGDERMRWESMGGVGTLSCLECDFAQEVTSFTHGGRSSNTGVQCQACGQFTSIFYTRPVLNVSDSYDHNKTLSELVPEDWPVRIGKVLGSIDFFETRLKESATAAEKSEWLAKIEDARRELSAVTHEQMQALELKHQAEKAADDALYDCECGGRRVNNKPLFCPGCRSLKLNYKVRYMT
jgi:hypothetical protein